jgi:hypothetical protein
MDLIEVKDTVFMRELLQEVLMTLGNTTRKGDLEFPSFILATVVCSFRQ